MNNVTNNFTKIRDALISDERNSDYSKRGILPIYQVSEEAKILIIGQAPGAKVEENGIPFMDKSGEKLRDWMGWMRRLFIQKESQLCRWIFIFLAEVKLVICRHVNLLLRIIMKKC